MRFLDSNIVLRYLTADDADAQARAAGIIHRVASGQEDAFTTDVHIHEVTYVLASKALYGLTHLEISDRLRPLLLMNGLKMTNKQVCLDALNLFAAHGFLDFADALAAAYIKHRRLDGVYSFDHDFDRLADMARAEN
ncbi:MAG TPA: PIN domain-containing protein [Chloroflexota bacterium]|jgi:predicted nucleic acid-binding protein